MDLAKLMSFPVMASAHGHEIDFMIYLMHFLMAPLFIGWAIYFIYVLLRFNRWSNPKANYHGTTSHASTTIEIVIAILETVLLVGFSIPFWAKQVNALPDRPDKVEIRVIAEQFAWNIHYPGADGIFGKTDIKFFDKQSNPLGLDPSDPNGKDDVYSLNQLHLPLGRTALIHLTSRDVMHSFALPVMRVKQDIIPGMSIPTWFTPTHTGSITREELKNISGENTDTHWAQLVEGGYIDAGGTLQNKARILEKAEDMELPNVDAKQKLKIFNFLSQYNFQIACAQLCGLGHYKMKGFLTIEPEETFNAWIGSQETSASSEASGGGDDFWN